MVRKLIILAVLIGSCLFYPCNNVKAATAVSSVTVKEYIVKHSMEMGIDPALALSIAKTESGYCHEKRSSNGAVGVFQLMPSTAKKMGYNPYYLSDNIKGGLKYYQMMYKKFGSVELALAAYNAGPGTVSKYNGMPPFKETRSFVNKIMREYNNQKINPDPAIKKVVAVKHNNIQPKQQENNILKPQGASIQLEQNNNQNEEPVSVKDLLSMNNK